MPSILLQRIKNIQVTWDGKQVNVAIDILGPPIETDYFNVELSKKSAKNLGGPIDPRTYRVYNPWLLPFIKWYWARASTTYKPKS